VNRHKRKKALEESKGSRNYLNGLCLQRDRISLVKGEKDVLCRIAMPSNICQKSDATSTLFCIVLRIPGRLLMPSTYRENHSVCLASQKRTRIKLKIILIQRGPISEHASTVEGFFFSVLKPPDTKHLLALPHPSRLISSKKSAPHWCM
jgi:hypothetical protein